jgi:C_GCAxxG_C_C family probable redox protein
MANPATERNATEEIVKLLRNQAQSMYASGQLLCSEAVVVALNQGLHGGLTREQAISMASAFPEGVGGGGCLCGALGGGILALGLFLGRNRPSARDRLGSQEAARRLHDLFKEASGATCCRVLTKKVKNNQKEHFLQCAGLTGIATELAARLILERRPELLETADLDYLSYRESRLGVKVNRLVECFRR